MKKIKILIPVYNDWQSVFKLLKNINSEVSTLESLFSVIIVNDSSSESRPEFSADLSNLESIQIINMKENRGHARCNAFGLRYINLNEAYDYVILMDSDGEDRPVEIKDLIKKIDQEPETSVVAKRIKRSEGPIFQNLYKIHKLITLIFTGKKINFGNYSCLTKRDINTLSEKASLWSSFSGSVKKNCKKLNETKSIRGLRYFGPSKMSLINLVIHSFSIIAVFKNTVFLRSSFMIVILSFLTMAVGSITIIFQILIVMFNLIIFFISMRENENALVRSHENVLNEDKITN